MGQYFYIVNLDKKEYLHPHVFGDGLKLLEFADGGKTMLALAVLLRDSKEHGGGDFPTSDSLVGSWAGDRIVVAGDYGENGRFVPLTQINLHQHASDTFRDISRKVLALIQKETSHEQKVQGGNVHLGRRGVQCRGGQQYSDRGNQRGTLGRRRLT